SSPVFVTQIGNLLLQILDLRYEPSSWRRFRPANTFARMFMTSTKPMRTSAAAHAADCSPGSGDSEFTKISTGSVGSAPCTSSGVWVAGGGAGRGGGGG